jgi:excisionase family DNA binding protein
MMESLLNIKEAAEFLNVSDITIRRWTNSGRLKCFRVGGKKERRFYLSDLKDLLQDSGNSNLKPLGFWGQKVPDGAHMAHFYNRREDAFNISIPYVLEGIKMDETILSVMPPDRNEEFSRRMEEQEYPVSNWIRDKRLCLFSGMNTPEDMGKYLAKFTAEADGVRVLGDMIWTVRNGWDLEMLGAFERPHSQKPPLKNGLFICQYSLEDFTGTAIMMAAEYHRQVIYKGRLTKSQYYNYQK